MLPEREKDILALRALAQAQKEGVEISHALDGRIVELSQSIGRGTVSSIDECNTLTPRGVYWLGTQKRLLLGRERLALQGYPWPAYSVEVDNFNESLLGDLAGNAMSGPCILACFLALFIAVVRIETTTAPEQSELADLESLSMSFARGFTDN